MTARPRSTVLSATFVLLAVLAPTLGPSRARAQAVDDGSDAAIGKADTRTVLDLIKRYLKDSAEAKVTALRRSKGSIVCGSVNVKGPDGRYLGERGFVVDLAKASFGRVPDGPELLSSRAPGFAEKERIRQLYFEMCLD